MEIKTSFSIFVLFLGLLEIAQPSEVGQSLTIQNEKEGIKTNSQVIATRSQGFCVAEHNRARSQNGKGALTYDKRLEAAARRHNEVMAKQNCFSHQCPGEQGLGQRISNEGYSWNGAGENIAKGHANCQAAVNGWMNSPGHKANILGNFKHVGCHRNTNGNYYTCVFGSTW